MAQFGQRRQSNREIQARFLADHRRAPGSGADTELSSRCNRSIKSGA